MTMVATKRRNWAMRYGISWILAATLILPTPALAADAAAPPAPVHSLSEAEVARILDAAVKKRETANAPDTEIDGERPQVHGEIGVGIGTGGYRSAFGTAFVPLGDGLAIISFDTTDLGSNGQTCGHYRER